MKVAAIVNPAAGGGRCGRAWRRLEPILAARFPGLATFFTERPPAIERRDPAVLPAAAATSRALEQGADLLLVVGGDGTVHEAVNGYLLAGGAKGSEASLSLVTVGTGGDFSRNFGLPAAPEALAAHIAGAGPRLVDAGCVVCHAIDGEPVTRYFANIASFGLSGAVCERVNRGRRAGVLGGRLTYARASLMAALRFRPVPVEIVVDGEPPERSQITAVAVANGRWFGGGMMIAPGARLDDGRFDVVVIRDASRRELLRAMPSLYRGRHLSSPRVALTDCRRLRARAPGGARVLVETDGESPGMLPASFELLPGALRLRV